jgi:TonB family protein
MPRELFASAVAPPRAARSCRSSIVLVSGIGHAAAGVVLLVASLTATGSLPVPHQPLAYFGAPQLVRVDVIDATGRVQSLRVLRSVPLLDGAAMDAVGRWQYTPAQLNNKPIPVMITVTVSFRLQP